MLQKRMWICFMLFWVSIVSGGTLFKTQNMHVSKVMNEYSSFVRSKENVTSILINEVYEFQGPINGNWKYVNLVVPQNNINETLYAVFLDGTRGGGVFSWNEFQFFVRWNERPTLRNYDARFTSSAQNEGRIGFYVRMNETNIKLGLKDTLHMGLYSTETSPWTWRMLVKRSRELEWRWDMLKIAIFGLFGLCVLTSAISLCFCFCSVLKSCLRLAVRNSNQDRDDNEHNFGSTSRNVEVGLNAGEIESLDHRTITSLQEINLGDKYCTICLEKFEVGNNLIVLPCSHEFHTDCVQRWLYKATSCPNCRTNVMVKT